MATRWNRRRLVATFVVIGVISLLYLQHDSGALAPWDVPPSDIRPPGPPIPPTQEQPAPTPYVPGPPTPPPLAPPPSPPAQAASPPPVVSSGKFHWSTLKLHYPIAPEQIKPLPSASPEMLRAIPKIQYEFGAETAEAKRVRLERLAYVKANFTHAWTGYKTQAWLKDEVRPIKGGGVERFGGWAATLVDSLDTLWIMGLTSEFEEAVAAIDKIDFTTSTEEEVNVFETTIRYLGGFLAAYDLSGGKYPSLLQKAVELGDMLYVAFDTPNHVPIARWKYGEARKGVSQKASRMALVSEPGSLSMEFTRLSQLSGNAKYYDAVQRVMDLFADQQDRTFIPGLWPVTVNTEQGDFTGGSGFTIGGMADSLYEYLPKEHLMLGGASDQYRTMYLKALAAMDANLFFRPRTKSARPMLFPGDKTVGRNIVAAQVATDMETARQLVEGCLWGYENAPNGIMPEIMEVSPCPRAEAECVWSDKDWYGDVRRKSRLASTTKDKDGAVDVAAIVEAENLRPGIARYDDTRYILRPEAIESIFVLYRLTGEATLLDRAWAMFEAIVRTTTTPIAHAALKDCTQTDPRASMVDSMESFWLAETLKYFYLLYASPDLVSLDEYVLNTEAHPLRRPRARSYKQRTATNHRHPPAHSQPHATPTPPRWTRRDVFQWTLSPSAHLLTLFLHHAVILAAMALPLPPGITPAEVSFLCEMELVTVVPRQRLDPIHLLGGDTPPLRPPHRAVLPLWLALLLKRQRRASIVAPPWLHPSSLQELVRIETVGSSSSNNNNNNNNSGGTEDASMFAPPPPPPRRADGRGGAHAYGPTVSPPFLPSATADAPAGYLPYHWLELAEILLAHAPDDLPAPPGDVRGLLRDLAEARAAKVRQLAVAAAVASTGTSAHLASSSQLDSPPLVNLRGIGAMELAESRGLVTAVHNGVRRLGAAAEASRRDDDEAQLGDGSHRPGGQDYDDDDEDEDMGI
ncbi:class 1 alpha-mannosidase [Grosmannia clavigera kw1407]|uniref:alpha-1,2-Mannosidase n=1 Tax=Grosmannia clavigera (strain kw1407 / UAMH 11150) TaxID=655863 RepID=F0X885_GROCL|nr:class 1 alpha-mannosidase [Grosmannia clavigera kw1407]EFX05379.1 class 1 alpha-mannosidase [Grosmannia clavigera kw1407]